MYISSAIVRYIALIFCFAISSTSSIELSASASISSSRTVNSFSCPEQFGYYPDNKNCEKYFVCSFGVALHKNCTNGLYFSVQLQNCDWPSNVLCENDFKTDIKPQSGYSVVDVTDDRKPQPIKPFSDKPVIEIKPRVNQNLGPKLRTASVNIETYVPESDSFAATEPYDLTNSEYTLGSHSEPTGILPKFNHFYNIENFNKTDSRNNYNLDNIYKPFLPTVSPTVRVDGFNVPLKPTLKSSEHKLNYETTQSPVARNLENNNHKHY
jgi:hypothetical protein